MANKKRSLESIVNYNGAGLFHAYEVERKSRRTCVAIRRLFDSEGHKANLFISTEKFAAYKPLLMTICAEYIYGKNHQNEINSKSIKKQLQQFSKALLALRDARLEASSATISLIDNDYNLRKIRQANYSKASYNLISKKAEDYIDTCKQLHDEKYVKGSQTRIDKTCYSLITMLDEFAGRPVRGSAHLHIDKNSNTKYQHRELGSFAGNYVQIAISAIDPELRPNEIQTGYRKAVKRLPGAK